MKAVGTAYVKNCYNRYARKYFHEDVLPDFSSLDFEFAEYPRESGSVEFDEHGLPNLALDPFLRKRPCMLRSTLLHEMIHLKLGPGKIRHGKEFYEEALRIANIGGIRVWA